MFGQILIVKKEMLKNIFGAVDEFDEPGKHGQRIKPASFDIRIVPGINELCFRSDACSFKLQIKPGLS